MRKYLNLIFLSLIFYHEAGAALPISNSAKELRYFLVEEGGQTNLATSVVLGTKTLYQVEQKIQLFNVFLNNYTLVLFSVLPDKNSNSPTWNEVDLTKQNVITKADLMQINEIGKKTT